MQGRADVSEKREDRPCFDALDFVLLETVFAEQVQRLFPVPVSIEFVFSQTSDPAQPPVIITDTEVCFALSAGENDRILVRCFGYDQKLHWQLDRDRMQQLYEQLILQCQLVRQAYIDPVSGMYNRRALEIFSSNTQEYPATFLLCHVMPGSLTLRKATTQYQRILDVFHNLRTGCCFSLGTHLLGILFFETEPSEALLPAKELVEGLKKEKVRSVHAALCRLDSGEKLFEKAWQGLLEAELRGPYVVFDTSVRVESPFALPDNEFIGRLQKTWRGLDSFQVVVTTFRQEAAGEHVLVALGNLFGQTALFYEVYAGRLYCVFPLPTQERELPVEHCFAVQSDIANIGIVSVGVGRWPGVQKKKSQTVVNALKALFHASFHESGAVIVCNALTFNISGDYFFEQEDYRHAAKEYRLGLQLTPLDKNLLNSLGVTLIELNRLRSGLQCFEKVLNEEPDNFMALVNSGFARMTLGQREKALDLLSQAYEAANREEDIDDELLRSLSKLLMDKEEYGQAVEVLDRWSRQSGCTFMVYRLLGESFCKMGRYKDATVAFQQALHMYPHDSVSLSLLGVCYVKLGEGVDIGIRLCRQALELDLGDVDNSIRLAHCLIADRQWDEAERIIRSQFGEKIRRPEPLLLMAQVFIGQQNTPRAVRILKRLQKMRKISSGLREQVIELLKGI
ncbi:MAG: hypothetical protein CSA33_07785 [Desulfobulbus propionicus]|nr:MAG: hypothetical protein CSA33_07785 [Desulfobulbus propionicus]